MGKIQDLEQKVINLYKQKDPRRDAWADWLFEFHVKPVADYATQLAKQHDANPDLARASALLHDIADAKMSRFDETHEAETMKTTRQFLEEVGYDDHDIEVIEDAVKFHSCRDGQRPRTLEGKVLASADAMAHFLTDYYVRAVRNLSKDMSVEEIKDWVLKKIDRDLTDKIFFDDVRDQITPDYERLKNLFSR